MSSGETSAPHYWVSVVIWSYGFIWAHRKTYEPGSFKNESFWSKKLGPCNEFHVIMIIMIHKMFSSYFDRTLIEIPIFHLRHDSALNSKDSHGIGRNNLNHTKTC